MCTKSGHYADLTSEEVQALADRVRDHLYWGRGTDVTHAVACAAVGFFRLGYGRKNGRIPDKRGANAQAAAFMAAIMKGVISVQPESVEWAEGLKSPTKEGL